MAIVLFVLASYLIGCLNGGYYLVRFVKKADIRQLGSGNAGATNTGRVLGKTGFIIAFLIDFSKGILVVWAVHVLGYGNPVIVICGLAVIVGHLWPVQLQFRGGKGIATYLGVFIYLDLQATGLLAVAFLLFFFFKRHFVGAGMTAITLSPFFMVILGGREAVAIIGVAMMVVLLLIAHQKEIKEFMKKSRKEE